MANGNTVEYNYICTKSGNFQVKDIQGNLKEHSFSKGDKVCLKGFYVYGSQNYPFDRSANWNKVPEDFEEPWYKCDYEYYGDYIYLTKHTVENFFRPLVKKHLEVKEFNGAKELNDWLLRINKDDVRDIKPIFATPTELHFVIIYVAGDEV